jgi:DNA invertase Pin-like site-specific DNA recombinase
MDGRFVSYLRVSTQRQGRSGLGREAQQEAVNQFLNGGRHKVVGEFEEIESGKRDDNRPELQKALAMCRIHRATLLVAKIDRLARNVAFVSKLMESGVKFQAVDMPEANNLTVHILAAMAEHEAKMISERTKAALAAVKRRGTKLGGVRRLKKTGQPWDVASVAHKGRTEGLLVRREKRDRFVADIMPMIEEQRRLGATTLQQIADALNANGAPAPRGGEWSAMQVMRVLKAAQ